MLNKFFLKEIIGLLCYNMRFFTQPNPMQKSSLSPTQIAQMSEQDWQNRLTSLEYYVLRQKGTERPFTGEYTDTETDGIYHCKACNAKLFDSQSKFHSGCGWPSFDDKINQSAISEHLDTSHGMIRTEVCCANCGSHLGHLFDDNPNGTGLRYCINSVCLTLQDR